MTNRAEHGEGAVRKAGRYRLLRPLEVEARRWDGTRDGIHSIAMWVDDQDVSYQLNDVGGVKDYPILIGVEGDELPIKRGDWVVRWLDYGFFDVTSEDEFPKSFALVEHPTRGRPIKLVGSHRGFIAMDEDGQLGLITSDHPLTVSPGRGPEHHGIQLRGTEDGRLRVGDPWSAAEPVGVAFADEIFDPLVAEFAAPDREEPSDG